MIFSAKKLPSSSISKLYSKCLSDVKNFYNYSGSRYPKLFTVKTRKEMDFLYGEKTENWLVGFSNGDFIFTFSPEVYEKYSVHKYSKKEYESLIKHEMSHFYYYLYANTDNPLWLNEGLAYCCADQVKDFSQPKKFSKLLKYYDTFSKDAYIESSHAVSLLIDKFGKKKVIQLIKSFKNKRLNDKTVFVEEFEKIYKSKPTYSFLNGLIKDFGEGL
ncbi:hypothetical protein ACFLZ4_02005 [Patescibacteria group bacterium]